MTSRMRSIGPAILASAPRPLGAPERCYTPREMPRPKLDPTTPLTELHVHLGAAVTPAIMWGIAHAQGIRLPTKDYWEFRDLITAGRRRRSFQAYLELFHWTELIQSSPIAVERSVYEVIGGAYRKNNVTRLELRFNPMKRNRGGEQDLDHIIAAALRGMDQRDARVSAGAGGPDLLPGSGLRLRPQRDHRRQGDRLAGSGGGGGGHRRTDGARLPLRATTATCSRRCGGRDWA